MKSTREAAIAGELGGNVLEPKGGGRLATLGPPWELSLVTGGGTGEILETVRAAPSAPVVGEEFGFSPAPGLVSALLGERPEIDMDEDTLSFLRRRTARPATPGPRCGRAFDASFACFLDEGHPGNDHTCLDNRGTPFVWRVVQGGPDVIVYDKRSDMILGQTLTVDWPKTDKRSASYEKFVTELTDTSAQMNQLLLGDGEVGTPSTNLAAAMGKIIDSANQRIALFNAIGVLARDETLTLPPGYKLDAGWPWQNPVAVEPGQVWDAGGNCPRGWTEDGLLTVMLVDGDRVEFRAAGGGGPPVGHAPAMLNPENPYRCVGFELAPGRRVMVGEVYVGYAGTAGSMWIAVGVMPSGGIRIMRLGGGERGCMTIPAERLIRWSLWTNPARMEPGQVWEFKDFGMSDGRYVVTDVNEFGSAGLRWLNRPIRRFDGGGIDTDAGCKCAMAITTPEKARCIGFELEDGRRVMVGDLVKPKAKEWPVHSIRAGALVVIRAATGLIEVPMKSIGDITSVETMIGRAILGDDHDKPTAPNPFRDAYQAWKKSMTGEAQHSSVFDALTALFVRENIQFTASPVGALFLEAPAPEGSLRITTPEEVDAMFGAGTEMAGWMGGMLQRDGGWFDVIVPPHALYTFGQETGVRPDARAVEIRRAAEEIERAGGGSVDEVEGAYRELQRAFPDPPSLSDVLRVSRQASFAGIAFPYHEVEATTEGALITLRGEMMSTEADVLAERQDGLPQELVIPTLGTVSMVLTGVTRKFIASKRDRLEVELRFASPAQLLLGNVKDGAPLDALVGVPGVTESADSGLSAVVGRSASEVAMIADGWVIRD